MKKIIFSTIVFGAACSAATIVGNVGNDTAFNNYMKALGAPGFAGFPPTVDYTYEVFSPQGRIGNSATTGTDEIGLHRNNPADSTPPTSSAPLSPSSGSTQYSWGSSGFANTLVMFELSRVGSTVTFTFGSATAPLYKASFTDSLAADVNLLALRTRAEATTGSPKNQALLTDLVFTDGMGMASVPDSAALDSKTGDGSLVENVVIKDIVGDFVLKGKTNLNWDATTPSGSALAWQIKAFRDVPSEEVPEPATFALAAAGVGAIAFFRRKR